MRTISTFAGVLRSGQVERLRAQNKCGRGRGRGRGAGGGAEAGAGRGAATSVPARTFLPGRLRNPPREPRPLLFRKILCDTRSIGDGLHRLFPAGQHQ